MRVACYPRVQSGLANRSVHDADWPVRRPSAPRLLPSARQLVATNRPSTDINVVGKSGQISLSRFNLSFIARIYAGIRNGRADITSTAAAAALAQASAAAATGQISAPVAATAAASFGSASVWKQRRHAARVDVR